MSALQRAALIFMFSMSIPTALLLRRLKMPERIILALVFVLLMAFVTCWMLITSELVIIHWG